MEETQVKFPEPGKFRLSQRSLSRLAGVHPDLLAVVHYAIRITPVDFGIPEDGGVRTDYRQMQLVAEGKSKTRDSRHLTGHAVDNFAYVDGKYSDVMTHVMAVHYAFVKAGQALGVPLRWGGDWDGDGVTEKGENDFVHHELPKKFYGPDAIVTRPARSKLAIEFLLLVNG
jgi:peptidoglycan L-alanyl-D-glutamate endopeptidase CwlK